MREIKFRGKRIDNTEWIRGGYIKRWNGVEYKHYIHDELYEYEVDRGTVGQYTGLKDKYGTEIYEGDIIFRPNEVGRIEFSEDGSFLIRFPHHLARLNATWEPIEVIGNIHDTPELLEAES